MSASAEPSQPRQRINERPARISNAVIALLPVLACFLGGATEKWAEGIVVAIFGVFLIVRPPRLSLGPVANFLFVAVAGFAAVSLFPARWFFMPEWRTAVMDDFGILLPPNTSPQPWITA